MTDERREAFEKHAKSIFTEPNFGRDWRNKYINDEMEVEWETWLAACNHQTEEIAKYIQDAYFTGEVCATLAKRIREKSGGK